MAAASSKTDNPNLDSFYQNVLSKEPSVRLECFPALETYLSDENTSLACDDFPGFIDGLLRWIEGSNFRIACNGLRALEIFADRLDSNEFERYLDNVISPTVDRLGDAKDQVREAASNLLIKLMTIFPTQRIWDLIQAKSFDHKQFRIKEESQRLLIRSLNEFGASTIQLNKLVPLICKLVSDSNGTVRQQAIDTLVEIYRHVGEKVRSDIAKRDIPEAKLKQLYEKFDDVMASGRMLAKASEASDEARPKSSTNVRSRLNSDSSTSGRSKPASGISTRTSTSAASSSTNPRTRSSSSIPRPSTSTVTAGAAASGAVDELVFEEAFDSSRALSLSSGKDVENQLASIRDILADTNNDWEKRVEALKRLRSVVAGDGDQYDEFFRALRPLDLPLVATVKDLRSQIVREACITLSYMSVRLTNRFERTAESVLPAMMLLIQNSAKIISTSAAVGMRFIVTHTQSMKLIPLIMTGIESKSKEIRKHTYELLVIILSQWDLASMEKHGQLIHDAIKKGLSDADADARSCARKAFGLFREHFPLLAEALLASLDPSKKKTLMGEMSNASSTHSLASISSARTRTSKDVITKPTRPGVNDKQASATSLARSSSANELALKQKNALSTTGPITNTASATQSTTNRPRVPLSASSASKRPSLPVRPSKTVSQSQPGSRSTSPNSLRSLHHLSSTLRTPTNARSRIPTGSNNGSRISSRESSPGRTPLNSNSGGNRRRLGRPYGYRGPASEYGDGRRISGSWYGDSGDDASETSSICSERALEDVADILRRMSSNEWAERKESLSSLYHMIRSGRVFSPPELKRLTDLLTKRFYDSHSQVFASFLDVLPEFIIAYKRDLNDWLYALLTRLLIRLGAADLLDSVAKKLKQCLAIVNSSFDVHSQFLVVIRFINDNSSAPGIKVKEILLRYLQQLIQHMEPVDITNNNDIRIVLSKIINWSNEPKSMEMRKAAQAVILALHNLNRPEFSIMLTALPQTFQDAAAKILRTASDAQSQMDNKYDFFRRSSTSSITSPMTTSMHSEMPTASYASDIRILTENMQALNVHNRPEDASLASSTTLKEKEHRSMIPVRHYTPQSYRSSQSQSHKTDSADTITDAADRPAAIDIALNVANTTTLAKDQRQQALRSIFKFAKVDDVETWDLAFSKALNSLTQILDNPKDEALFKVYSLRILRELLIYHTNFFLNYVELTIFRILKAQSESENDITRSAEQAAHAAAQYLPPESTIRVLKPIIEQAKFPMNQSAIAMLQKTIELMSKDACTDLLPELIPPLLTAWDSNSQVTTSTVGANSWDNETSSVRKAAVFCLVSIYLNVGDAVRTHLHKLNASKLKLLNVYISKAQQQTTDKSTTNGNNPIS